jgi:putative endonuclease
VYVLLCADFSFYCGITTNIERRLKQHNGEIRGGAKYTRSKRPCRVLYYDFAENRSIASKKEAEFKKLSRKKKEEFLTNYFLSLGST